MTESTVRECKVCNKEKERIFKEKYPDGKNKKWVDQYGREWSGMSCPDCHALKSKENMKKHRLCL